MEKEFIPYEQALILKELGFNESCFGYSISIFKNNLIKEGVKGCMNVALEEHEVALPLYQQAFRWFREKYAIFSSVWDFEIERKFFIDWGFGINTFKSNNQENLELECLKKLIEIVKNKK